MYSDFEDSLENGTPFELYSFTQGVENWNYVSGSTPIVYLGKTYIPFPVLRDRIKQSSDVFKDGIKLSFPRGDPFAAQYLGFAPEDPTILTVYRGHYGDLDSEVIVYWKGRVVGAKAFENTVDLQCESIFTSIKRPGLRGRYEYTCRHTLYLKGCNVNRESFVHTGLVTSITSGINVDVQGAGVQPDGYYTGGMLVLPSGAARFLTNHVGDTVTLARTMVDLTPGLTVAIYPGCDHLISTCNTKFNNLNNFGGFPFIPSRNPFDGSSIV